MVVDIYYDNLHEEIKDILVEGDVASNHLVRLKDKIILALRYHALIPDRGIEMVRITNEDDYERLIDIKNTNPSTNVKGKFPTWSRKVRYKG